MKKELFSTSIITMLVLSTLFSNALIVQFNVKTVHASFGNDWSIDALESGDADNLSRTGVSATMSLTHHATGSSDQYWTGVLIRGPGSGVVMLEAGLVDYGSGNLMWYATKEEYPNGPETVDAGWIPDWQSLVNITLTRLGNNSWGIYINSTQEDTVSYTNFNYGFAKSFLEGNTNITVPFSRSLISTAGNMRTRNSNGTWQDWKGLYTESSDVWNIRVDGKTNNFWDTIALGGDQNWTPYHPKDEKITMWKDLWNSENTSVHYAGTLKYESIGNTYLNKSIWMFECGNPDGPVFLWDSEMHGDEDMGSELLWMLATGFLFNETTTAGRNLQNKDHILFIPVVDYDTNSASNRTNADFHSQSPLFGTNINRNFVANWANYSSWINTTNYEGPYATSEPETQAMRNVFGNYTPEFYVNLHCGETPTAFYYTPGMNNTVFSEFELGLNRAASENGVDPYPLEPKNQSNALGYAIGDATDLGSQMAMLIETDQYGNHTLGNYTILQSTYLPKIELILGAEWGSDVFGMPLFGMKTKNDGFFNWPNATYAPSFGYMKVEYTFTNVSAGGDQCTLNVTGYPFDFPDGKVDGQDIAKIALHNWQSESTSGWNYLMDEFQGRNTDGLEIVDGADIAYAALHFGQGYQDTRWYNNTDWDHVYVYFEGSTGSENVQTATPAGWVMYIPNDIGTINDFKVNNGTVGDWLGAFVTFWSGNPFS